MPFSSYKNLGKTLKKFQISYQEENFVTPSQPSTVSDFLKSELEFALTELVIDNSEAAVCENLVYPILKEVWKPHRHRLMLWSHEPLHYDEDLSGVPDYIITKKSPLGKMVFDQPYLILVEAKRDNFSEGWGQCLAELVAAQKLNEHPEQPLFGIVSNGDTWEFGRLTAQCFTKHRVFYTIQELSLLVGALNDVLLRCE
jgi:hypothetical protein